MPLDRLLTASVTILLVSLSVRSEEPVEQPEITVAARPLVEGIGSSASTTMLSGEALSILHVQDPSSLVRLAPNFSTTDSGTGSFADVFSVRGLTNTVFFGPPSVALYVDDAPSDEPFTFARKIPGIRSVEFLRGPQPTTVGRGAYGGLINIQTLRPGNKLEGEISMAGGSYDHGEASGWVMGPLIRDLLSFRFGGGYESREGYLKNPDTGARPDSIEHWGYDGGLYLKPAEGWEISLTANWDRQDDGAPRLTSHQREGFYDVLSDHQGVQNRESDRAALRIAYESESLKFLSVTSHRRWQIAPLSLDADYTAAPLGVFEVDQEQETWSQEFRLASNDGDKAFQWNLGMYGATGETTGRNLRTLNTARRDITTTPLALSLTLPRIGTVALPPVEIVAISDSTISAAQKIHYHQEENAFAFYGGGSWSGWEPFTLHAGARVDWVRRSIHRDSSMQSDVDTLTRIQPVDPLVLNLPRLPPIVIPVPTPEPFRTRTTLRSATPPLSAEDEWVHFTPTVGLDWKAGPHALVYAKTTYAFKPGGYSAYADDRALFAFDPEKCWSSEAGIKTQWLNGGLIVNFAGFYNRIQDYQIERGLSLADYVVLNAAHAETFGAELEASLRTCRFLDLSGSFGWTHARFTDHTDPLTGATLGGNTIPFVPEWDAVLAADFHLDNGLFLRAEYLITGRTTYDEFNRPEFEQEPFGLFNAAVGWRYRDVTFSVYATNLTGEEYYSNINTTLRTRSVGVPREYGVRMTVRF